MSSTQTERPYARKTTEELGYQPHGDGGPDRRGNPTDRRNRKLKILGALPIKRGPKVNFGGNGTTVPCFYGCGTMLDYATLTVDRIDPFGSYAITNVRAACWYCNKARGVDTSWTYVPSRDNWGPNSTAPG